MGSKLRDLTLILAWLGWAWPSGRWLVQGWLDDPDGLAQLAVAAVALVTVARSPLRAGADLRPLPLLCLLGGPALALAAPDLDSARAACGVLSGFGLLGLFVAPGDWRRLGAAPLVGIAVLPVSPVVDAILGWPLRKALAHAAAAVLGGMPVETVIAVQGSVTHVDAPCAGIRSLWALAALILLQALRARVPAGPRLALALALGASVGVAANLGRVVVIVGLAQRVGWPLVADSVHVPLGLVGFALALGAGVAVLWVPDSDPLPHPLPHPHPDPDPDPDPDADPNPHQDSLPLPLRLPLPITTPSTSEPGPGSAADAQPPFSKGRDPSPGPPMVHPRGHPEPSGFLRRLRARARARARARGAPDRVASHALSKGRSGWPLAAVVALLLLAALGSPGGSAPIPPDPPVLPARFAPIEPSDGERAFAVERGGALVKGQSAEGAAVALVASRSWLAHHAPDQCLRAAGWVPGEERLVVVDGVTVRRVELTRARQRATAIWWFQSGDRVTDDLVVRIRDGWATGRPWVLVSVLVPDGVDPEPVVRALRGVSS